MTLPEWWSVPRHWVGETAFIVGGGASVLGQDLELLRGRRVIAINSSYERLPFADYVIGHDQQWWREHADKITALGFRGQMVAPTQHRLNCTKRHFIRKRYPPGLSLDPAYIAMKMTTFSGAINLAALHGVARIVLLGADGKLGVNGQSHHHRPHRWWKFNSDRWPKHHAELKTLVGPLRKLGIDVVNASPGTAWGDLWPVMTLEQAIEQTECRRAA